VGDLTAVRCDDLISDIVKNLVASDPRADDVSVQCDLLPLHLSSDRAIPLALIATESIINALKYGTDTHNALLTVKMAEVEDGQVSLEIRNAAIDPDLRENGGMGMKLKQAFARQLRGTIERSVESGVYRLSLVFPKDESD
jgi:two-component sensor histidine kinase